MPLASRRAHDMTIINAGISSSFIVCKMTSWYRNTLRNTGPCKFLAQKATMRWGSEGAVEKTVEPSVIWDAITPTCDKNGIPWFV